MWFLLLHLSTKNLHPREGCRLSSSHMIVSLIVICETWAICVFNVWIVNSSCLGKVAHIRMWIERSTGFQAHASTRYRISLEENNSYFKKSIESVLRCFQFYSSCDLEKDRPSNRLTLQGKARTITAAEFYSNRSVINGGFRVKPPAAEQFRNFSAKK